MTVTEPAYLDVSPRGYAQRVEVTGGSGVTVYISGQVPIDSTGALVGAGDLELQTDQVFRNIETQLEAAGGTMADLVHIDCYFVDLSGIAAFRRARDRYIDLSRPPASAAVQIDRLVDDRFLIEVSAIAVVAPPRS